MKDCPLCNKKSFPFYITFCDTHCQTPLIVSCTHKKEFSMEEKYKIKKMFHGRNVRFEMRSLPLHAHAHIE